MHKIKLLLLLLMLSGYFNSRSQSTTNDSIAYFQEDLSKLIQLNPTPGLTDFSFQEAIHLNTNATAAQLITVTAPYLNSSAANAKWICLQLLTKALLVKAANENQKQEIVEILCHNYLHNRDELQMVDNCLLMLHAKDFNVHAKKYLAALMDSMHSFDHDICATLFAVAQIKESIPLLWKLVNRNIETLDHSDIDILASLARLGEKEAGTILCNYYNTHKNRTDYRYIFNSRKMAFSLAPDVLDCMVSDFKTLDLTIILGGGDSFFNPSWYLAGQIVLMIKNYPYAKNEYEVNTKQLMNWLTATGQLQLRSK